MPSKVMLLKEVSAAMSFEVDLLEAEAGKIKSSPATGFVPPQLASTFQRLLDVPVQVLVAAFAIFG